MKQWLFGSALVRLGLKFVPQYYYIIQKVWQPFTLALNIYRRLITCWMKGTMFRGWQKGRPHRGMKLVASDVNSLEFHLESICLSIDVDLALQVYRMRSHLFSMLLVFFSPVFKERWCSSFLMRNFMCSHLMEFRRSNNESNRIESDWFLCSHYPSYITEIRS